MENTATLPSSAVLKHNQLFPPSFLDRPLFRRLTHKCHSRTLTFGSCMMNMTEETSICEHKREFHREWTTIWLPGRSERGCIRESQRTPWNAHSKTRHHSHSKKRESKGEQCFLTTSLLKSRRNSTARQELGYLFDLYKC